LRGASSFDRKEVAQGRETLIKRAKNGRNRHESEDKDPNQPSEGNTVLRGECGAKRNRWEKKRVWVLALGIAGGAIRCDGRSKGGKMMKQPRARKGKSIEHFGETQRAKGPRTGGIWKVLYFQLKKYPERGARRETHL